MNTHRHQLTDPSDIHNFVFGGKATFTLVSSITGNHLTFKVSKAKDGGTSGPFFVAAMTGPDNELSYSYLGHLWKNDRGFQLIPGKKTKVSKDAKVRLVFEWFLKRLKANAGMPDGGEFWHEGKCGKCGRKLTVPLSIERGLGPICDPRDRK
jgi:hypothetical protein